MADSFLGGVAAAAEEAAALGEAEVEAGLVEAAPAFALDFESKEEAEECLEAEEAEEEEEEETGAAADDRAEAEVSAPALRLRSESIRDCASSRAETTDISGKNLSKSVCRGARKGMKPSSLALNAANHMQTRKPLSMLSCAVTRESKKRE